jgi:ADP-heptose:LPS heptosyltransferase
VRRLLALAGVAAEPPGTPPHLVLETRLPPDFIFAPRMYIVVHPFPTMKSKTLPPARWVALLQKIRHVYPLLGIVVTGSRVDEPLVHEYLAGISHSFAAVDLPILEVAGMIEAAAAYVGVDTGITHIAGMVRAPSIVLCPDNNRAWLPSYNENAKLLVAHTVPDIGDEEILGSLADAMSPRTRQP